MAPYSLYCMVHICTKRIDILVPHFLQVLVTMFTNVLSNSPSDPKGLTALAIWILGSLILVFIALLLYVAILVNMRRMAKKTGSSEEKSRVDFDSIFLLAHLTLFAIFIIVYALAVFAWNCCYCYWTIFGKYVNWNLCRCKKFWLDFGSIFLCQTLNNLHFCHFVHICCLCL